MSDEFCRFLTDEATNATEPPDWVGDNRDVRRDDVFGTDELANECLKFWLISRHQHPSVGELNEVD